MKSRTHIFSQEDPEANPRMFSYGKGKYTSNEVDKIIRLLPPHDKAIRIIWVEPDEYMDAQKQREALNNEDYKPIN